MKNFDKHINAIIEICENHKLESVYLFDPVQSIKPNPEKYIAPKVFKNLKLGGYYKSYLVFKTELDSLLINNKSTKQSSSLLIDSIDDN